MPEKTQTNTDRWCILIPIFTPIEIPTRTIMLEEGSISKTMFFIEKGCLRTCINNNGKDITTQFFLKKVAFHPLKALWLANPVYIIESIESCVLQTITQKDFQDMIHSSPELKDGIVEHLYDRLLKNQQVFFSYLKIRPSNVMSNC